jgi:hypothetical protein
MYTYFYACHRLGSEVKDYLAEYFWYNRERERENEREREIASLSCGRLATVLLKFHCQLRLGEPLVIGREGWIQIFER